MWIFSTLGGYTKDSGLSPDEAQDETEKGIISSTNSKVFPTLPLAIKWLRDNARQNQSVRVQVKQATFSSFVAVF